MNKTICCFLAIMLFSLASSAQVIDGAPNDSTIVRFTGDTLSNYIPDSASIPLWQIGHSHKSFFGADSIGTTTIMTDTIHPYRINADNWFVIKIKNGFNTIVDFWHKYQADSAHAGGLVEFSMDHGLTWQNIKGPCNVDSGFFGQSGVLTSNCYTYNDTLITGQPSFSGIKDSTIFSRFQFFIAFPEGPPGASTGCDLEADTFYVRFRFISDSTPDTLAGWIIDSIKIENDAYGPGLVKVSKSTNLPVFPNPSYDGTFNFPVLYNEQQFTTEVYDHLGRKVLAKPYTHQLDLSYYPQGIYFYKVSDGAGYYSGQLVIQ